MYKRQALVDDVINPLIGLFFKADFSDVVISLGGSSIKICLLYTSAAISKMELLKSICLLISRGALISMAVILVVLPAALMPVSYTHLG